MAQNGSLEVLEAIALRILWMESTGLRPLLGMVYLQAAVVTQ
jgi:hypothetical protein